jgi:hypothetical protein
MVAVVVAIALFGSGCNDSSSDSSSYYPNNGGYSGSQSGTEGGSYGNSSSGGYGYDDGGIAPDRFDPQPARGPYVPG